MIYREYHWLFRMFIAFSCCLIALLTVLIIRKVKYKNKTKFFALLVVLLTVALAVNIFAYSVLFKYKIAVDEWDIAYNTFYGKQYEEPNFLWSIGGNLMAPYNIEMHNRLVVVYVFFDIMIAYLVAVIIPFYVACSRHIIKQKHLEQTNQRYQAFHSLS